MAQILLIDSWDFDLTRLQISLNMNGCGEMLPPTCCATTIASQVFEMIVVLIWGMIKAEH